MTEKQLNLVTISYVLVFAATVFTVYFVYGIDFIREFFGYWFEVGWLVAFFMGIIPLMFLGKYVDRVRIRKLKSLASEKGWSYDYFLDVPILKVLVNRLMLTIMPHPLQSGCDEGIVGKINEWKFTIFDGEYAAGSEAGETSSQTIFVLNMRDVNLPVFGLEPNTFGRKLIDAFKKSDIKFVSNPNFSKKYYLYGENESDIRYLFKDQVLEFFEAQEADSIYAYKDHLVMYRNGTKCDIGLIEDKLKLLVEIAKVLINNSKIENRTIKAKNGSTTYW